MNELTQGEIDKLSGLEWTLRHHAMGGGYSFNSGAISLKVDFSAFGGRNYELEAGQYLEGLNGVIKRKDDIERKMAYEKFMKELTGNT